MNKKILFALLGLASLTFTVSSETTSDEKDLIEQYKTTLDYMIAKDVENLDSLMTDEFVLVHMTGMRQPKSEYLRYITEGELNYKAAKIDNVDVKINGTKAVLTGQARVTAAVFGGSTNTWRLQLVFTMEKINNKWLQTGCKASTY